jgi:glycine C-acetyltransferase
VGLLRQRARPYLFSNAVPSSAVAGALAALRIVSEDRSLQSSLQQNAALFRQRMTDEGFTLLDGGHPIVPVMFSDETMAVRMADELFSRGIYATAFSYPVVPYGRARIRVQLSSAHTFGDIETAVTAFVDARASCA